MKLYMYLNICTYMSQQMQLMYPETPCFGENTRTQKITQNTQKYTLRRAIKVTSSKFRGRHRQKTAPRAVFLAGVTDKNDAHLQFFLPRTLIFSMIVVGRAGPVLTICLVLYVGIVFM